MKTADLSNRGDLWGRGLAANLDLMPLQAAWMRDLRPAVPCKAHSARTKEPCKSFAMKGTVVCRAHGGMAPQVRRAAEFRLAGAATEILAARMAARLGIWTPEASRAWVATVLRTLGIRP
jgi:hypothetical protein